MMATFRSPTWEVPIMTFIDENCVIFDNDKENKENKLVYTEKHREFCQLIDNLLSSHLSEVGTSTKLRAYATARMKEISQGGESTPSVYPFAMDTSGSFCDTAILFLKKIALVKFSNEPGSEPLLAWKRASWVQETCLLIQAAVLRTASRLFHRGLRVCFKEDYEHLFDVPQHSRTDNDVSGLAPIYIPAAG